MSYKWMVVFFIVLVFFLFPMSIFAETSEKLGTDVVIIIDTSGSMERTDQTRKTLESAIMLMDMMDSTTSRVGVVQFTDDIKYTAGLTPLSNTDATEEIKQNIKNFAYLGYTDIGLALKAGVEILLAEEETLLNPFIVLFTDGMTEIGPLQTRNGRTVGKSHSDVLWALEELNGRVPVHTIGLNRLGSVDVPLLNMIAEYSTATANFTLDADDLPGIFTGIYQSHMETATDTREPETGEETGPTEEAEPTEETEPGGETEPEEETEPREEIEPEGETETGEETEPAEEIEPEEETEPVVETELGEETKPEGEIESDEVTESGEETEPIEKTEPGEETDPEEETEPVEEIEPEEAPTPQRLNRKFLSICIIFVLFVVWINFRWLLNILRSRSLAGINSRLEIITISGDGKESPVRPVTLDFSRGRIKFTAIGIDLDDIYLDASPSGLMLINKSGCEISDEENQILIQKKILWQANEMLTFTQKDTEDLSRVDITLKQEHN